MRTSNRPGIGEQEAADGPRQVAEEREFNEFDLNEFFRANGRDGGDGAWRDRHGRGQGFISDPSQTEMFAVNYRARNGNEPPLIEAIAAGRIVLDSPFRRPQIVDHWLNRNAFVFKSAQTMFS